MMKTLPIVLNISKFSVNRVQFSQRTVFQYDSKFLSVFRAEKFVPTVNPNREFCSVRNEGDKTHEQNIVKSDGIGGAVTKSGKYELFKDENAPLILDVIEERQRIQDLEEIETEYDEFAGLNLERGVTGVFDIEDLVDVLRKESAKDIFVAKLPSHLQYVDYIVVVTGKSLRHMLGLAEFVRKVFKIKRHKTDMIPKLEGEDSKDWLALDLGNIALHIMSKSARRDYDLESLWAVGKEYDEKSVLGVDPLTEILKKHSINLDDFQPADTFR